MAERMSDETQELESTTIGIYRTAAVVKGGRRFSFSALVVVGDRRGRVGIGYGKAPGVPAAIEKAQKAARRQMHKVTLHKGTLPHAVTARFGASLIKLVPAAPGTGVIAGATARAVLEMAGIQDCLTKSFGSNNPKNLAKAVMQGLLELRSKDDIARVRGVELDKTDVEEILEAGQRFAPSAASAESEKAKAPVNTVGQKGGKGGKGKGGRGRGGGGGGGRGRGDQAAKPAPASDAAAKPAAAEAPAPAQAPSTDAPAAE